MRNLLALALVLAAASPAFAGDGKAGRKPVKAKRPVDLAGALASNDASRICQAAIDLARSNDLPRAGLLLPRCPDTLTGAMADAARQARAQVRKAAETAEWSPVEIVLRHGSPDTTTITIEQYPDVPVAPGAVNLPPGTYRFIARTAGGMSDYELTVAKGNRALVMLDPPAPPPAAKNGVVDFGKDEPMPTPVAGPPPPVKHGSLIPARYLKGMCPGKRCPSK